PLLAAVLVTQDRDRLLAAVPEDAIMVASLASLDDVRAHLTKNELWKFAQSDDMRAAREELERRFVKALDDKFLEKGEDVRKVADPLNWLAAVHGPMVYYAATTPEGALGGFGILLEPGKETALFDELWDAVLDQLAETQEESTQEYQGAELTFFESGDGS